MSHSTLKATHLCLNGCCLPKANPKAKAYIPGYVPPKLNAAATILSRKDTTQLEAAAPKPVPYLILT